jgi:hypothetical protein
MLEISKLILSRILKKRPMAKITCGGMNNLEPDIPLTDFCSD